MTTNTVHRTNPRAHGLERTYSREKIRGWRHGRREVELDRLLPSPYAQWQKIGELRKYSAWVSGWALGRGLAQYVD